MKFVFILVDISSINIPTLFWDAVHSKPLKSLFHVKRNVNQLEELPFLKKSHSLNFKVNQHTYIIAIKKWFDIWHNTSCTDNEIASVNFSIS